ncbi:MAG TPA: MMPL family transporter [Nocardioides sp.]
MRTWGALVARRAGLVVAVSLVVAVLAGVFGVGVFGSLSNGGFDDPDSEAARERVAELDAFGNQAVDVVAVYSDDELSAQDPEFEAAVRKVVAALPQSEISSVVTWYDNHDPALLSKDGHATSVVISLAGTTQDANTDNYDAITPALQSDVLQTDIAGPWAVFNDVNTTVSSDLSRAEEISMPFVLLLSLIIFGSVVAALMPVLIGGVSVVGALAVVRLITLVTDVSVFSVNVITLIGMGLAIDYALFVVSRFREELAAGRTPEEAVETTMATAGRTVLFSGLTVAAAMSSLLIFPQEFLRSIGYGGIAAVLVAMVAALTILPAVLRLLGHRIDAWRIPLLNRRRSVDEAHGAWARLARAVMARPIVYVVVIAGVLLLIAAPFLGVRWGSVDYRVLPQDSPAHIAYEKLNTDFGPESSTANVLVTGADQQELASYTQKLGAVDGVVNVSPLAAKDGTTLLRATWEGNTETANSQRIVHDLRDVPVPDGAESLVGGQPADTVDLLDSIGAHLPLMGLFVVAVMFVLLFLAFGSLVLPVKAVLMNAFSITASFGVVTWIFSDGHLEGPLGFTSSGFLDATQPILMLAILFGLSMDYEVFLLSRVREQWDRTHNNDLAVASGVQKTGRIITSAALLLAIVIGAFGTSGIVFMKMLGIGMLVALLIDATVVRALLVPATMKLLGEWNWWAPGALRRWWERYGFREYDAAPAELTEPEQSRSEAPARA